MWYTYNPTISYQFHLDGSHPSSRQFRAGQDERWGRHFHGTLPRMQGPPLRDRGLEASGATQE